MCVFTCVKRERARKGQRETETERDKTGANTEFVFSRRQAQKSSGFSVFLTAVFSTLPYSYTPLALYGYPTYMC